jgi:hypothetical protein
MLIGEQPGNDEDFPGKPFVGLARRIRDQGVIEVDIDRSKHCRWWTDLERALVGPSSSSHLAPRRPAAFWKKP